MNFAQLREHYSMLNPQEREYTDFTTRLRWALANIPEIYTRYQKLEDIWEGDEIAKNIINQYLDNLDKNIKDGIGIHLYGNYGTGKTLLSCHVLREAIRSYDYRIPPPYSGHFLTFENLISLYTSTWGDEEENYEKIKSVDLLVVDDLGREYQGKNNLSPAALDNLLRNRVYSGLPTIITSNLSPREIEGRYGGSAISLLWESAIWLNVKGEDFRKREGSKR